MVLKIESRMQTWANIFSNGRSNVWPPGYIRNGVENSSLCGR